MRCWKAATAALIRLGLFARAAQAAAPLCTTRMKWRRCAPPRVQQELMVAGLTCHASDAYNRFVLAYRPELQKSDADLKSYFMRRGGAHGEGRLRYLQDQARQSVVAQRYRQLRPRLLRQCAR